jgi:hypothetical protein
MLRHCSMSQLTLAAITCQVWTANWFMSCDRQADYGLATPRARRLHLSSVKTQPLSELPISGSHNGEYELWCRVVSVLHLSSIFRVEKEAVQYRHTKNFPTELSPSCEATQLVKKFSAFYGSPRLMASHSSLKPANGSSPVLLESSSHPRIFLSFSEWGEAESTWYVGH